MFSGSEPLLNKDTPELMKTIRARKRMVGMIGNGILLEDGLNESKSVGRCDIQLSVYENTNLIYAGRMVRQKPRRRLYLRMTLCIMSLSFRVSGYLSP
jgi:hypothetical protein